ncbi:hypothetical protein ABL78_2193 [Leptomonas seymouri]|uniref:Leucine-rich repeat protein n=1 Tax=Leptomonas seymouri TaxID=5684 RepID=A0A0N1PEG7_LEPSE|nr:hypothetical protein ABL78_2193 [Leptomonas seymouri]|eukprot:KPI88733.1 hypothetical protein ABL78_2193 [Leptomonas seymouri]
MSASAQISFAVPVAYDLDVDVFAVQGLSYASSPTEKNLYNSISASKPARVVGVGTAVVAAASSQSTGCTAAKTRSGTRSVADVIDDIFYTYTGINSWAAFSQIQREGVGLRQQLQSGAVFEHPAVQPVLSSFLIEWTRRIRALQAGRTCAVEASTGSSAERTKTSSRRKRFSFVKKRVSVTDGTFTAAKELDLVEADNAGIEEAEEDGLLPLWSDIEPTQRCGPSVLHAIRGAVHTYCKALLHLVTLAEQFSDHWGHLSTHELKHLHTAMAHEKAAHVPSSFIFSVFTELNATEERLGNAVGELAKCDRMEVLRLNCNPTLTELKTLPPNCRVVVACACQLQSFLLPPALSPPNPPSIYASLTTLGLAYNQLRDVQFISLLPALTVLDASFNCMTDTDAVVRDVAAHDALAEVSFQGNPFALLDTYRAAVIRRCVRVDKLDRIAITSEERTLSFQKMQLNNTADTGEAAEQALAEMAAPNRKVGRRKSDTNKLTLPAVIGTETGSGATEAVPSRVDPTSRTRKSSLPKHSLPPAISQITLFPPANRESAPLPSSSDDVTLRTTVAAAVELLVLRGLSTFEPVVQTHTVEELMPSSAFVYELAGLDGLQTPTAPLSRGTSDTLANSSSAAAASIVQSRLASSLTIQNPLGGRKCKAGAAAAAGGRLGMSLSPRGNSSGGIATAGGKRAVVVPPLYEVTSRVCIEGCWGGRGGGDAVPDVAETKHDDLSNETISLANTGVRVEFKADLAAPPPVIPQRGGARHGGNGGRALPPSVTKPRKKATVTPGGAAFTNGNAANGGTSGVRDPYVLSGASSDGTAGRHNSLSGTGVYAAQLPLTHNLVAALQQPLVLHVVVEDTYRYMEEPVMKAVSEMSAAAGMRGNSANRGAGGASLSASQALRDAGASPATPLHTSPLPEAVHRSSFAQGSKAAKEAAAAEAANNTVEERQRRKIGVIRLNPFDLFINSNDAGATSRSHVAQAPSGLSSALTTAAKVPTSGAPLPTSRVIFEHGAEMETDMLAIQAMQHELQLRQCQLQESLFTYNILLEQYVDLAGESKGGGMAGADAAFEPVVPPFTLDVSGTSSGPAPPSGQMSPRRGKRAVLTLPTAPCNPPLTAAGVAAIPTKPSSRSSHLSMSPKSISHLPHLQGNLKEQQIIVVRQAVRIMALQARLEELEKATLRADARLSIGRGPSPPPSTSADAALDALRYRKEAPQVRKGRSQPSKAFRR